MSNVKGSSNFILLYEFITGTKLVAQTNKEFLITTETSQTFLFSLIKVEKIGDKNQQIVTKSNSLVMLYLSLRNLSLNTIINNTNCSVKQTVTFIQLAIVL